MHDANHSYVVRVGPFFFRQASWSTQCVACITFGIIAQQQNKYRKQVLREG